MSEIDHRARWIKHERFPIRGRRPPPDVDILSMPRARWLHWLTCRYGSDRLEHFDRAPISFDEWIAMGEPGDIPP